MNLIVVVFDCFIIFISLCCCPRRLSPPLAMEFVSLARSRRNLIRKASSDKVGDDTNAKPSYSPAKESITFSVSNDVTDPQHLGENEQRKFATPRIFIAGDLIDGDENVYGDVRNSIPTAPCIERAVCKASLTEQQLTSPITKEDDGPDDDDEYDPYVYYGTSSIIKFIQVE